MKKDVIIIGSGVVGLTMAACLEQQSLSVAVIDAKPITLSNSEQPDLRVYAINQASQKLLTEVGAWQYIPIEKLSPYRNMYVWDECSNGVLSFSAQEIAKQNLGYILEERVIKNALLKALQNSANVSLQGGYQIDAIEVQPEQVYLSADKAEMNSRLIIGADGANSWLRSKLDFACQATPYNHHAIVCYVEHQKEHQQTAYQIFTKDGPLAFLPSPKNNRCSIVWSVPPQYEKELMALSDEAFKAQLEQTFQLKLGKILTVSKRLSFPLIERVVSPFVKQRVALIGDALHTIHPLAGLGANLGLADVAALNSSIKRDVAAFDEYKTLRHYERSRKGAVLMTTQLMKILQKSFSSQGLIPAPLRGFGMNMISSSALLKTQIMRFSSGEISL